MVTVLEFKRHLQEIRGTWMCRALVATKHEHIGMVMLSVIADHVNDAMMTLMQAAFPGFESIAGQGLFVAAGTPRDIVTRINAEVNAFIRTAEMQERWAQMGIDRVDSTPEQFAAWLARESNQWALLIRSLGIKPD